MANELELGGSGSPRNRLAALEVERILSPPDVAITTRRLSLEELAQAATAIPGPAGNVSLLEIPPADKPGLVWATVARPLNPIILIDLALISLRDLKPGPEGPRYFLERDEDGRITRSSGWSLLGIMENIGRVIFEAVLDVEDGRAFLVPTKEIN